VKYRLTKGFARGIMGVYSEQCPTKMEQSDMTNLELAYAQGQLAYLSDESENTNPYDVSSQYNEFISWISGWGESYTQVTKKPFVSSQGEFRAWVQMGR
jgi:ribosome modulation factor